MAWWVWALIGSGVFGVIATVALCRSAGDADDQMERLRKYFDKKEELDK